MSKRKSFHGALIAELKHSPVIVICFVTLPTLNICKGNQIPLFQFKHPIGRKCTLINSLMSLTVVVID